MLLLLVLCVVISEFAFRFARVVADLAASCGETNSTSKSLVLVILRWMPFPLFANSRPHPSLPPGFPPGFGGAFPGRDEQKAYWLPCFALYKLCSLMIFRVRSMFAYIWVFASHSEFCASLIDNFQPPTLHNPLTLILGQNSHLFKTYLEDLGFRPFQMSSGPMFFGFYDTFLIDTTNNIGPEDIRMMSKHPRKMEEVIDAMDLILVVWHQ
jgi:hypothetical protein